MRSQRSASFMKCGDEDRDLVLPPARSGGARSCRAPPGPRPRSVRPGSAARACAPWPRPATGAGARHGQVLGSASRTRVQAEARGHLVHASRLKRAAISSTRAGISASGTWNSRACSTRFPWPRSRSWRALGADGVDQVPELRARQRPAGGRFVQDQQVRVVDQRAHSPSFCFMPPDSLPAGRRKAAMPVLRVRLSMRRRRSAASWPNSRPKN